MAAHKNTKTNKTALSIVLVIAETFLSYLVRFDKPLQKQIAPMVNKKLTICIRTYLPHYVFYISFTDKGLLLDSQLPEIIDTDEVAEKNTEKKEDILISCSMVAFVKLLFSGDETLLHKLQFRGDSEDIDLLKECIKNIGIQNVFRDLLANLKKYSPEEQQQKTEKITKYKETLSSQEEQIDQLNKIVLQSETKLVNQDKKIKTLNTTIFLLFVVMIVVSAIIFF